MSSYPIKEVVKMTGLSRDRINRMIAEGVLSTEADGNIKETDVHRVIEEHEQYISLYEYAVRHTNHKFNGNNVQARESLLDAIERRKTDDLKIILWKNILMGTKKDFVYFERKDIPLLDDMLDDFFLYYGMSEQEKVRRILSTVPFANRTKHYIQEYIETKYAVDFFTNTFTEFVKMMIQIDDVTVCSTEDIHGLLSKDMLVGTREYMVDFLNYVKSKEKTRYGQVVIVKKESVGLAAYDYDTYIELARCFFNADYIADNQMIEKALANHIYAEMWLYITLFFTCGWRAGDICRGWKYPELSGKPDSADKAFGINRDTLHDDLLYDRISDDVYISVCEYAINSIDSAKNVPHKTIAHHPSPLMVVITPELQTFFGLLTLIGEANNLRYGDGYMKTSRAAIYQNKVKLREFFGPRIREILGNQNLQSRRLNKGYLQAIEEIARQKGASSVMASAVASYARNHTDLNTIKSYLNDHRLTKEDAGTVLYYMMERGVFGYELYQMILTAFPDAMHKLSLRDQNRLIAMIDRTPLELEAAGSHFLAYQEVQNQFVNGNEKIALDILTALFEISQGRGRSKDPGVYCLLRAQGSACSKPGCESCLASCCSSLVFTRYGYEALISVLKEYYDAASEGDKRAEAILTKVLIPKYHRIINDLIKKTKMTEAERQGLIKLLEVKMNG